VSERPALDIGHANSTQLAGALPDEVFQSSEFQTSATSSNHGNPTAECQQEESPESVLVKYLSQYGGGSKIVHDLYCAYSETTAAYNAFLAMVASNYADDKGEAPPLDPIEHENRALREIAEQLSRSPAAPPSNTMLAVALLANLRDVREEYDLVEWHWDALRNMVEINGGIHRLRMHQSLHTFFF
jgi:hypothetical protein